MGLVLGDDGAYALVQQSSRATHYTSQAWVVKFDPATLAIAGKDVLPLGTSYMTVRQLLGATAANAGGGYQWTDYTLGTGTPALDGVAGWAWDTPQYTVATPADYADTSYARQRGVRGGNVAIQTPKVTNASKSDPNQAIIADVLVRLKNAFDANVDPKCSTWFDGPTVSASIGAMLSYNSFGHATIDPETIIAMTYQSGIGLPVDFSFTVNDVGKFFRAFASHGRPWGVTPGAPNYGGMTLQGRAETLLHELGHLVIRPPSFPSDGPASGDPEASQRNDLRVWANCKVLIEGLR